MDLYWCLSKNRLELIVMKCFICNDTLPIVPVVYKLKHSLTCVKCWNKWFK